MTTYQQALARAAGTTSWAVAMCDNFVANMWGSSASGYNTAVDNWQASPDKHPNDMKAPAGALMYWGGGEGHVALSTGDGNIISTDIGGSGTVTTVPATKISQAWGKPYLGWASPYFGGQSYGTVGPYTGPANPSGNGVSQAVPVGFASDIAGSLAKGFLSSFMAPFTGIIKIGIWMTEAGAGIVLMAFGTFLLFQGSN